MIPLARGLKKEYGAEVTVDLDFKPGENWRRKIADSVSSCDCTLIVIGKTWHTTKAEGSEVPKIEDPKEPVHEEIINALERRDDILVIPVLVENAKMPKLPSAITELADIEATKLRVDEWDADFERLARQATRRPGRLVAAVPAINSMR